jgi:hypothetical protein
LCNRAAERLGLYEVGKASPAVDLDDGQPLAVRGLESVVAGDVDELELEVELLLKRLHLLECAFAQMAARRVVEDDVRLSHTGIPSCDQG